MADLLYTVGADASNFNQNIQGLAGTAQNASNGVSAALATASQSVDNLGGSALSASMRFQQMRSGLSAMRDGTLAFAVGGQRADMMLMAMGHHITSLVNETGSLGGAFKALGSSLLGPGGVILALTVAYEIYKKLSESEKDAYDATKNFASASDATHAIFSNLNESFHEAVKNVDELKINVDLAKRGFIDKNTVVKEYNDTMGKTTGAVKTLDEVEQKLVRNGDAYLKMMLYKAAAQSALKEAADKAVEIAKAQATPDDKAAPFIFSKLKGTQYDADYKHAAQISRDVKAKEFQADEDLLTSAAKVLQQKAADISKAMGYSFGGTDKPGKENKQSELQRLEQELKKLQSAEDDLIVKGHIPDLMQPTILERSIISLQALIKQVKELNSLLGTQETNKTIQDSIKRIKPGSGDWASDHGFADSDNTDFMPQKDKIGGNLDNKGIISDMQKTAAAFAKHNQEVQRAALLQKRYNTDVKETDRELKSLERTLGEGLNNALQSALSGSENFFKAMGNFIVQLIQQLVAAVIEALILASILSVVSGGTTSVMGELGAVSSFGGGASSGAALLGSFGKHAAGGIFTTPHVGMFGEAGPEAIVTPKHLQEFAGVSGGGGGKDFTVTHKVSGSDMLLLITRANKSKRRTS